MARRRGLSQQETAAYARQAVDRVARADETEAEARRVLDEAPDDRVRQAIVETSAGAPDNVTGALVNAALQSGSVLLAQAAADFLVDLARGPNAMELLQRCFASDDASVRRRAGEALENFADPAAVLLLAKGLTDESPAVRRTMTGTLGFIVGAGLHPLRETILEALSQPQSELARAIVTNADDQVRRQAVQALSFVKSDLALPAVGQLCEDEDEEVRQEAVLCLAAIGSDRAVELMAKRLSDPSYRVASSVLDMLAAIFGAGSPRLLGTLQEAMSCPLPEVRRQAVLMLDRFNVDQVGSVLERAVTDDDFEVARRASEMLRKLRPEGGLGWLAEEISQQTAGDKALSLWEAGNIGLEVSGRAGAVGAGLTELDEVVAALEKSLREGSSSDKVHALNELAALVDIADSDAMQDALEDKDPSVRSRATDALSYTRDAGLLARVLRTHPDPMARRRAIEAMTGNPGGPGRRGALGREIAFTSTRTVGMELFSYFLAALDDSDPEVRQYACAAIRDCAQGARLLPVRQAVRQLERLASDEEASFAIQEEAEYALEAVKEGTVAALIAEEVDNVLAWRGQLAREAHAIRWDDAANAYTVDRAAGGDAAERWAAAYKLSDQQLEAARGAVSDAGPLEQETARRVLRGLVSDISAALDCVVHAARAVRLIGEEGHDAALQQWAAAVQTGPEFAWGPEGQADDWRRLLLRLRKRAAVEVHLAQECFAPGSSSGALAEAAGDEDDWVKLTALAALAELDGDRAAALAQLQALCREHVGEQDYCEPIGGAAVGLLKAGVGDAVGLAEAALRGPGVESRVELTQQLLFAAQEGDRAHMLRAYLADRTVDDLPTLCLALALRGAGNTVEGLKMGTGAGEGVHREVPYARLALRAMDNDSDAAQALEKVLREGDATERYYGACYLMLARVRSAVLVFSSVRDRDAPYMLRGLCAASLIRQGHPGGPGWFRVIFRSVEGGVKARIHTHLSRAVEDTIPVMLECKDVNLGRFV